MARTYEERFLQGYIEAALWFSVDDDDHSLEQHDLADETEERMKADCKAFIKENWAVLESVWNKEPPAHAGHDFWLTREGHGSGFWDRDLGEAGKLLTDAAHAWGEADLYVGDDDLVYQAGGRKPGTLKGLGKVAKRCVCKR